MIDFGERCKKALTAYLLVMGLYETIGEVWRTLELLLLGKIVPRKADTVIALLLAVLLYRKLGLTAGRES